MRTIKKFGQNRILFLLFSLYLKIVYSVYLESFNLTSFSDSNSLIEISDYFNLSIFMTISKEIYKGIPPQKISSISSPDKFNNLTSGVTYNENYILLVCTDNYLVSKIEIETGNLTPLINHDNIAMPNYTCKAFTDNDYLYISMSHIIIPKKAEILETNNTDNYIISDSNILSETNYFSEFINYSTDEIEYINNNDNVEQQYLEHSVIKIKLIFNETYGPIIDAQNEIIKYELKDTSKYAYMLPKNSIFSCEVIKINNINEESKVVCGYIQVRSYSNYHAKGIIMSENITEEYQIKVFETKIPCIKLQRLNSESIIVITSGYVTELTIEKNNGEYILKQTQSIYLSKFESEDDLFFYNNDFLFSSTGISHGVYIHKNNSFNYFKFKNPLNNITKVLGFYNEINDSLLSIYECINNKIFYFTLENITFLYDFKAKAEIKEVISNTTTMFNIRNLIKNPSEFEPLQFESLNHFINTKDRRKSYDKYIFDNKTQNITIYGSDNDWVTFEFYYEGIKAKDPNSDISCGFFLKDCKFTIRTCQFKCGSCKEKYDVCISDSCKQNFAKKKDDTECYGIDQNFPTYKYYNETNAFEKCYPSCKFCSKIREQSSTSSHNCIVCEDNYLKSYQYPGNCYQISFPYNNSEHLKYANNIDDENFTLLDSCPVDKSYKIIETGECVSSCPTILTYYTYIYNKTLNLSLQEENFIGLLYPLTQDKNIPKFSYHKGCYSKCPSYTKKNDQLNKCECLYAWNYVTNYDDILCYDNQDYCHSPDYYYHDDTKECKLNNCNSSYFKFNFECFKDKCPEGTKLDSQDSQNCIPSKPFCYINEYFKTICSDIFIPEYPYRYDDTKIYLKYCNDSIYYFNTTTYFYNNICYKECPIETYLNISEGICLCKYYIHYLDINKTRYECLKENEKCIDKNLYNISELKQCVDTKEECINLGYKIFNKECIHECPNNTEVDSNGICLCKFYFLNISNIYTCFSDGETCENVGYPIKKNNSNECFQSQEECTIKGFKYFNDFCYDSCPENTEDKNNNGICLCNYYYINNTNRLECLTQDVSCGSRGYNYINMDTKECFTSLESCKNRNLKIFNDSCYSNCPENTKENNADISSCICSYYFYTDDNNELCCFDQNQKCDTIEGNYLYTNIETKECFESLQACMASSPMISCINSCLDSDTDKCDFLCDPRNDYIFNDICYKFNCPQGTKLNISNPDSRICICEEESKIEQTKGFVSCVYTFPEIQQYNKDTCPYFYNKKCVNKCPENTCLNPYSEDLKVCEDMRHTTKLYNEICIEGVNEYIQKIVQSKNDEEITPIELPSGVILNSYSVEEDIDKLIDKYPYITYVDLGECIDKLKYAYKLPNDTKLYILGIDTPNFYGNSTINVFNYEIYLKNGTQLEDLSVCNDTRIKISSNIKDLDAAHFYKAMEFYKEGYDIFNKSNSFYQDYCAPAQDNGNDITLIDRGKYYYPKASICNDGCIYNMVNFETKRFICKCNADLEEKEYIYQDNENPEKELKTKEEDLNYLEYFLSLMNYKIFLCHNLFFEFSNFYYNAGFYIGVSTLSISISLMIIFLIKGMNHVKMVLYNNIPTKEKLLEIVKKRKKINNEGIEIPKIKYNKKKKRARKKGKKRKGKDIIIYDPKNSNSNNDLFNLKFKINPPPKKKNIGKLDDYMNNKGKQIEIMEKSEMINELLKKSEYTFNNENEKVNEDKVTDMFENNLNNSNKFDQSKKGMNIQDNKLNELDNGNLEYNITNKSKNKNFMILKKQKSEDKNSSTNINNIRNKNNNINNIDNGSYNESLDKQNGSNLKLKSPTTLNFLNNFNIKNCKNINGENENNALKNMIDNNNIIDNRKTIKNNKKIYNNRTKRRKIKILESKSKDKDSNIDLVDSRLRTKILNNDKSLNLDLTFWHLIDTNDDEIDKKELNSIPYMKALRIDKRNKLEIFMSVFANEIGFLHLFYYKNAYSHLSLTISVYIFELLFDLLMNSLLYTDDVVSEKYHNEGSLSMITSLSLSFISNIISSLIVYIIAKLTNYPEFLEIIISNVKKEKKYYDYIIRFMKYIKIRLGIFYFFQLSSILIMIYYLFIFCTVYHQSQTSIAINYIIGALTSLAISTVLSIIISILRVISLNYHFKKLYNISRYIYEKF